MEEFGQHPYHPFWFLTGADELYIWQSQNELTSSSRVSIELNYFASSDPHHDISKQLVDTTFV